MTTIESPAAELDRLRDENAELRCRVDELTADAADLRWFRNSAAELLSIPATAPDHVILDALATAAERCEEWEWDHKDDKPRVVRRV